jgi:hypothetical protein
MIAVFTFKVSDLVTGLTKSNEWRWHGSCKAEIEGGRSLNRLSAELSVTNISESSDNLKNHHVNAKFDNQSIALELEKELSAAQADGTADALILSYWPENKTGMEFIGVHIGLRAQKYELFRTFLTLHFGRADLIGRITCSFYEFAPEPELRIPSQSEFLNGRPYFVLDDISFVFSANPLP